MTIDSRLIDLVALATCGCDRTPHSMAGFNLLLLPTQCQQQWNKL
ncbi:hypothetical protein [Trichocoleus sp. FACHB-591]|nr:hypothetical protein [Trichocoleus sp. FACHB-591]